MKKNGTIVASMLMIANFFVKIFGLLREILLAQFYGTSIYTDAYIVANNIPSGLFAAIGTSIATTFIPMYARVLKENDEKRANSFALHLIECLLVICFILTFFGEIFINDFVLLFASGFKNEQLSLAISFSRVLFPSIFGLALLNVLGAYLQQHGKFVPIAIVPLIGNVLIIISLFVSNALGNINILVWGTLLGNIFQVLFYIPWVVKSGIFGRSRESLLHDKYLLLLLGIIIPVFIGEAVNEINSIVDRTLVSGLDVGSVSALNYAYKIINLVIGVFVASIGTVVFPKLSKLSVEKDTEGLMKYGTNTVVIMMMVLAPIAVSLIVYRQEIVQLLFERGAFGARSSSLTSGAMACYAIGVIGMGARDVLTKIFYAKQKTKIPMFNGIFCAIANIILDIIMIKKIGLYGAALATALVANIGCIILLLKATKLNFIDINRIKLPVFKICISSIILVLVDLIAKYYVDIMFADEKYVHIMLCGITGIIGVVIYFLFNHFLKNTSYLKNI